MNLTDDEIRRIIEAIQESDWDEARLVAGDVTVVVSKSGELTLGAAADGPAAAPAQPVPVQEIAASPAAPPTAPSSPRRAAPSGAIDIIEETHAATAHPPAATEHHDVTTVGAPSLGLFWRSPKPGAPPFVEVGHRVEDDTTVCIVEVMKLMNQVKAGCAGVVTAIHPANGDMVEYGQPLVTIAVDS